LPFAVLMLAMSIIISMLSAIKSFAIDCEMYGNKRLLETLIM